MGRMGACVIKKAIALICNRHRVYQNIHYRNVEGA